MRPRTISRNLGVDIVSAVGYPTGMGTNERLICRKCKTTTRLPADMTVDYQAVKPWVYRGEWNENPAKRDWVRCPSCDNYMQGQRIDGKVDTNVVCRERCMAATGPSCECECGGENHGVGA